MRGEPRLRLDVAIYGTSSGKAGSTLLLQLLDQETTRIFQEETSINEQMKH